MKWNILSYAVAAAIVGHSALALANEEGLFRLDFNIRRGNSKRDLIEESTDGAYFVKRDGFVDMELKNERTFYLTTLKIGSNKDENGVLVDTGSSDLWVMSHDLKCDQAPPSSKKRGVNLDRRHIEAGSRSIPTKSSPIKDAVENKAWWNPFGSGGSTVTTIISPGFQTDSSGAGIGQEAPSNTCTQYGSFNTENSDTFQRNNSASPFQIEYADGTSAVGIWGHDDVIVGNVTVHSMSFAIANETSSDVGVLGIGLAGLETTFSTRGGGGYTYENLPIKMVNQGLINKNVYSLYLGKATDSSGNILFGAIDHAKFEGDLITVPIINSYASAGYTEPIRLEIIVNNMTLSSSTDEVTVTSRSYSAVLDTGSTLSYLPSALFTRVGEALGGSYSSAIGAYLLPCTSSSNIKLTLNIGGMDIDVPLTDLLLRGSSSSSSVCYLGILEQLLSSRYMLLGDNILRHAYVVYDLEDLEISVGQVVFTDDEDIEVITSTVPGAVRAADFSSTSVSPGETETSLTDHIVVSGTTSRSTSTSTGSSSGNRNSGSFSLLREAIPLKFVAFAVSFVALVALV